MLTIIIGFIFWTMTLMLGYLIGEREGGASIILCK